METTYQKIEGELYKNTLEKVDISALQNELNDLQKSIEDMTASRDAQVAIENERIASKQARVDEINDIIGQGVALDIPEAKAAQDNLTAQPLVP